MPHQCTNCGRTFPDGSKEMLGGCPDCGGNKFQFAPSLETRSAAADSGKPSSADDSEKSSADDLRDDVRDRTDRRPPRERGGPSSGGDGERKPAWPDSGRRPEDRSTADPEAQPAGESGDRRCDRSPDRRSDRRSDRSSGRRSDRSADAGSDVADSESAADSEPVAVDSELAVADSDGADANFEDAAQADARSDVVSSEELPPADEVDRPDPDRGRVVSEPADDQPSLEDLREELNQQFESIKILSPGQYELNLMELYNRDEYIISLQEDGRYVIDVPDSWRRAEE